MTSTAPNPMGRPRNAPVSLAPAPFDLPPAETDETAPTTQTIRRRPVYPARGITPAHVIDIIRKASMEQRT